MFSLNVEFPIAVQYRSRVVLDLFLWRIIICIPHCVWKVFFKLFLVSFFYVFVFDYINSALKEFQTNSSHRVQIWRINCFKS